MPNSTPPPVRAWFSRVPDPVLLAAITALLVFCWDMRDRMARVEERVDAIADRVGVDDRTQMAEVSDAIRD